MKFWSNLWMWSLIFMMIGASTFVIDRKWGTKIYGKFRKWGHPPTAGLPEMERGFIYNRSNITRWKYAGALSLVWALIMIGYRHEDPSVELIVMFVLPFATFIGFMVGPLYLRFKMAQERWLRKLDEVESGKIDVYKEVSDAAGQKLGGLEKFFFGLVDKWGGYVGKRKVAKATQASAAPPKPQRTSQEELDAARESVRNFGKK
jgi:hypothetical protein